MASTITMQHARYAALANFKTWLRATVEEEGLSRRNVADASGVDQSTVTRLLNGDREPTLDTALKIVDALA